VLIENRTAGEYLVCRHGWVGDYPDPLTFLDMFTSTSGNNDAKWKNPEYDALITASRTELDPMKRMEILASAERLLLENYVIAPLFHYVSNYVMSDRIEGVERDIMQTVRFDRARWK
jgi:oligopeptide transport system substrate-binding protein